MMSSKTITFLCFGLLAVLAPPARPSASATPLKQSAVKAGVEEVWSLGSLEDNKLLMWVGLAVDDGGRLYVSDALDYSLKVFDLKGLMLRTTRSAGSGAEEFQALRELALSRELVFAIDQYRPNILVFDKQLKFQYAIFQPRPISCLRALPDGTLAAACVPVKKGERPVIWLADSRGRTLQEIGYGADAAHPAGDRASFVLSGPDLVLAYNFKDKVERLDRTGRVIWSKKLFNFPDARFKSVMGTQLPTQYIYKDIAVDRAGRLYVLGGGPAEHPSRDVYVLSPGGEMVATIVLPDSTHFLYIDAQDFLYSRANDGLTIKKFKVLFPAEPGRTPLKRPRP